MKQQEKQWRTESDARTLVHYEEIRADSERRKLAEEYLTKEKEQIEQALTSMNITKNIRAATGRQ